MCNIFCVRRRENNREQLRVYIARWRKKVVYIVGKDSQEERVVVFYIYILSLLVRGRARNVEILR